jgi:hypothetical protein
MNDSLIRFVSNFVANSLQNKIKNDLDVIVESSKLREIPQSDKILISMKISEHGMEWIKMEDENGQTVTKLLPE